MKLTINGEVTDLPAIWWNSDQQNVQLIDQTKLPFQICIHTCLTYKDTADAIKTMKIRGAPSIGAAAAYGLAQAVFEFSEKDTFFSDVEEASNYLLSSRPTAVDLKNGLDLIKQKMSRIPDEVLKIAEEFSSSIAEQGRKIGVVGKSLIRDGMNILTHCHTGALALVDHGSAIAPLIQAWNEGVRFHTYVDETRPRIQGRLTSWELGQYGVEHTVICDSASGYLMSKGKVDLVILGADRVAKNGDIANKIGTYNLAVLANFHNIPFYTAFPFSTLDMESLTGADIKIEERSHREISEVTGYQQTENNEVSIFVYPQNTHFFNPAFDVTPNNLITGYITPNGILTKDELLEVFQNKKTSDKIN
ncbi:MAG: S-methyl-5-thioribose-1-phosphate isomerase [Candidatus Hodarchaeales archaeon]